METEFHTAVKSGDEMTLVGLLSNKIEVSENLNRQDSSGSSPVMLAASIGNVRLCKILLEMRCCVVTTINQDGNSLLHLLAKLDVSSGLSTSNEDNNNSSDSSDTNQLKGNDNLVEVYNEVLNLALERGADINSQNNLGDTPLHLACSHSNVEGTRFLLSHNALASLANKFVISFIWRKKHHIKFLRRYQQTALQYAEQNEKILSLMKSLLRKSVETVEA